MASSSFTIPIILHKRINFLVPLSWCLFEPIQTFRQYGNKLFFTIDFETLMLPPYRVLPTNQGKNIVFISSCSTSRFKLVANSSTTQIEVILFTCEKISSKPIHFLRLNPFTTNLAIFAYTRSWIFMWCSLAITSNSL